MSAAIPPGAVALVTGQSRPVEHAYPDGAIQCPWCGTGWDVAGVACPNPACLASSYATVESVTETLEEWAARDAAAAARQREREWSAATRLDRLRAESALWDQVRVIAASTDACMTCLASSRWKDGKPVYRRHRTVDYHERGKA